MTRENRLRAKFAAGQKCLGIWGMAINTIYTEVLGAAGYDFVILDNEHGPSMPGDTLPHIQLLSHMNVPTVVRVPWNDQVYLKRVLDAGAETLLFPGIQDAAEAARAVAATRYPPEGVRGLSAMGRASRFGTMPDYYRVANKAVGVVLQLETPHAIAQLEEIAAVPGVDALFVGPAGVSGALGHPGQFTHAAVMAMMGGAAQRARAIGMPIGTVGTTPDVVTRYRAAGFDYVAVASDLGLLMRGALSAVQALRQGGDSAAHVHTLTEGTRTAEAVGGKA